MEASLDTNVIIHLYEANLQNILFERFEILKVYEFIRTQELKAHATEEILELFDKDVKDGKIELITDVFLKKIGMYNVFDEHVKDVRILYNPSDLGEVYAISMAKTLGCICLVTDDIKEYGPHFTLMRIEDSEVIPFTFYELLLLDYLESKIDKAEFKVQFNCINNVSSLKWSCSSKIKMFLRRFWTDPYCESERKWMKNFCDKHQIKAKEKLKDLINFLN